MKMHALASEAGADLGDLITDRILFPTIPPTNHGYRSEYARNWQPGDVLPKTGWFRTNYSFGMQR